MPVTCPMTRSLVIFNLICIYRQLMSQCECLAASGLRCERTASTKLNTNPEYCWQHQHCQQRASLGTEPKAKIPIKAKIKIPIETKPKAKIKVPITPTKIPIEIKTNSQPVLLNFDTIQYPFQEAHMIRALEALEVSRCIN